MNVTLGADDLQIRRPRIGVLDQHTAEQVMRRIAMQLNTGLATRKCPGRCASAIPIFVV